MTRLSSLRTALALAGAIATMPLYAEYPIHYEASVSGGGGSGSFAPYHISSLRHGRISARYNALGEVALWRPLDTSSRFSYGFGADIVAGYSSSTAYERYDASAGSWNTHSVSPSSVWVQQLYGEVKYRGVFLLAGLKEHSSALLNQGLTSGDLIESGNSRPIPEVRIGFHDFQDIPFTRGWLQIQGEIAYGKFTDNGWLKDQYNYYTNHLTLGEWYTYKRCYFRTSPSRPFSVTFGMQAAGEFGGDETIYVRGKVLRTYKYPSDLLTFIKMFIPSKDGGEGFVTGNHLGSWDLKARYRLRNGDRIMAYFSWPWEDGSGIGKLNGWDGLWGVEYKSAAPGWLEGALLEYLDFTNQSGPIHFAPGDHTGTSVTEHVSGADDYYNNNSHRSYANYGMSIGTPALMAPIYNLDGFPAYLANAMRGFHVGVEGHITPALSYRLKAGYRKAWGNGKITLPEPLHLTSAMLEATWQVKGVDGLSVNAQLECDRGNMPCDAFGALVTVKYNGILNL